MCNVICTKNTGTSFLFIYFPHLFGVNNTTIYVLYHEIGSLAVKQAVDARKSSWKWAHLSVPVVDGGPGKLVLAKARGFRETRYREVLRVSR